jgi:hypothetical protein
MNTCSTHRDALIFLNRAMHLHFLWLINCQADHGQRPVGPEKIRMVSSS